MRPTPDDILASYRHLQKTPSGEMHAINYNKLKEMVQNNQDALYELVFSGKVTDEKELYRLIMFGQSGTTSKKDNEHWIPFVRRVWERKDELPEYVKGSGALEWYAAMWGIIE